MKGELHMDTKEKAVIASVAILGAVADGISASAASGGGYNACAAYRYQEAH